MIFLLQAAIIGGGVFSRPTPHRLSCRADVNTPDCVHIITATWRESLFAMQVIVERESYLTIRRMAAARFVEERGRL